MGPQDPSDGLPTSATTPIPPRVLPGRKRPESGALSVKSVMVAATAWALRTRTVSVASTSSNTLSFPVSSKSSSSLRQPSVKSKLGSMSMPPLRLLEVHRPRPRKERIRSRLAQASLSPTAPATHTIGSERWRRSCTRLQLSRQALRHRPRCLHPGRCPLRCLPAARHRTRYRTPALVWDPAPRLQGLQTINRLQSMQMLHQTLYNSRSSRASAMQHAAPTPSPSNPNCPSPDRKPRTGTRIAYRKTSGGYTAEQKPTGVVF
jgi:hypothetical protein